MYCITWDLGLCNIVLTAFARVFSFDKISHSHKKKKEACVEFVDWVELVGGALMCTQTN